MRFSHFDGIMSYNQVVPLRGRSAAEAVSRYIRRESTHSPLAHSWASARERVWGLSLRVWLSGTCGIRAHSAAGAARPLDAKSVILYNFSFVFQGFSFLKYSEKLHAPSGYKIMILCQSTCAALRRCSFSRRAFLRPREVSCRSNSASLRGSRSALRGAQKCAIYKGST